MQIKNCLLVYCFLFATHCLANDTIIFSNTSKENQIGTYLWIYEDKYNNKTVNDILFGNDKFYKSKQKVPNLGVAKSSYWIKFYIHNQTPSSHLLLELSQPMIDQVSLYLINSNGSYEVVELGENKPLHTRKYFHPNYIFDLSIPQNHTRMFLMKIKGNEQIMLPISIGTVQYVLESTSNKDLIFGVYFGVIFAMFLYNLFIYFTVKDNSYLYYVFYILFVGLTHITLQGYTFKYVFPDFIVYTNEVLVLFSALGGIGAVEFVRVFLQTKKYASLLNKGLYVFDLIFILSILLSFMGMQDISFKLVQFNTMLLAIYLSYIGFRILKKGSRAAKFFLIAWSILLLGSLIFILKDFGLLPYNPFTSYSMQAVSAIETILLSFALADRINILKKEKEESQIQALKALQENERIILQQTIVLEAKVEERTVELKKSNSELNVTLQNLKETQSQLVNSEKMASLGQLTAGVAHEINNPINFVTSSIKPLKRDIADIVSILSRYEEVNESNIKEKIKEINVAKSELDIDYVKEEITSLLKGIEEGASRTAEIVQGLKTFSRLDEIDLKKVDLNEGIDSTLILLNSMVNGKIHIVKEYGTIPKVECFAGRLNQVFMNILSNAIYAVLKKDTKDNERIIKIKTEEKNNNVVISIRDNGTGIPSEVKNKIFDPFFTTKDVGEGTGLGLSIVYNIIETHKGKIELNSEIGEGTEFIITLPKLQTT